MKKKLLLFVLMLASFTGARAVDAGNIVSISNIKNVVPGYSGSFDIELNANNTWTFIALGLDVQLPEGFTFTSCEAGPLLTAGHASLIQTSDQGNNTTRISSYSNPNRDFTAITGSVLKINFSVASTAVSGTAYVKNAGFTYAAQTYHADEASALLSVGDMVTLDETVKTAPLAIDNVYVTVNRTITAGNWNTICLPFAMTTSQVESAFGNDVQIGDFTGYNIDDYDNISVNFSPVTAIEANHPYIIKVSSTINSFSITDAKVNISPVAKPMNNKGTNATSRIKAFIGTYVPITLEEDWIYIKDNTFKYSTGTSKLKPYRGYFRFWEFYSTSSANLFIYFDEATGVNEVKNAMENGSVEIFNLQGQRVMQPQKGLYISNGKKVINK